MKKLLNLKTLSYFLILASAVAVTLTFSGCDKKDPPPPSTTGGGTGGGTATVDYILFDGYRVEMKSPVKGTMKGSSGDTTLEWRGNQPTSIDGDTVLWINHESRAAKTYPKFVVIPFADDEVSLQIRWGTSSGRPRVDIIGGTYKLERVDGFWVSTLKNGTGEWDKGSGDIKTYTGIEFRATWPD